MAQGQAPQASPPQAQPEQSPHAPLRASRSDAPVPQKTNTSIVRTELIEDLMQSNVELIRFVLAARGEQTQAQAPEQARPAGAPECCFLTKKRRPEPEPSIISCPHCDGAGVIVDTDSDSDLQGGEPCPAGSLGFLIDALQILLLLGMLLWILSGAGPFLRIGHCQF